MISKDVDGNEYEVSAADLSWRPSAYGVVIHEGRILLTKEPNGYHLPGGGIDLGEDLKDAVVREVREECGITVTNPRLIDVNNSFFSWKDLEPSERVTHVHSILLYYLCDCSDGAFGEVKLDEFEQQAGLTAEWVDIKELDNLTIGTTVNWLPIVKQAL